MSAAYVDPVAAFRSAAATAGVLIDGDIIPDGRLHRVHVDGDPPGSRNGWYTLHLDGIAAGAFGSWRADVSETWCARRDSELLTSERAELRARFDAIKLARDAETERVRAEARERARELWESARPETSEHRYLRDRGVVAHGIRSDGYRLIIPMRDAHGVMHSLQRIVPDGEKRYLTGGRVSGCYHAIGTVRDRIYIAEGYATAATVHEATGDAVAVAFSAGNLLAVAKALRGKYRDVEIVIAADDDHATPGNPGVRHATEAARAIGGRIAIPMFAEPREQSATDWNDLARAKGIDEVRVQLRAAPHVAPDAPRPPDGPEPVLVRVSDVAAEPIRWLWPGRLALGKVSLLAGDPGLGKSLVSLAVAAAVSRGTLWPVDGTPAPEGEAVLLSAEDDVADTIRPRLEAAGADVSRIHVLTMVRDTDQDGRPFSRGFSLRRDLELLADVLAANPAVRLVVVDPISAYLGDTDSHNNAEVRGLLAPLAELAARHRVAVLGVSHLNKSSGPAMYRTSGSLAFVAAARAVFVITRDQAEPARRLLLPVKNNLAQDLTGLAYSVGTAENGAPVVLWEPEAVTVTAEEALAPAPSDDDRGEREEAEAWLQKVLAPGSLSAKDIFRQAREAGIAERTLKRAKARLGVVTIKEHFSGGWRWKLPAPAEGGQPRGPAGEHLAPFDETRAPLGFRGVQPHEGGQRPVSGPLGEPPKGANPPKGASQQGVGPLREGEARKPAPCFASVEGCHSQEAGLLRGPLGEPAEGWEEVIL